MNARWLAIAWVVLGCGGAGTMTSTSTSTSTSTATSTTADPTADGSDQIVAAGAPRCETLTVFHQPPREWGGQRVPDLCEDEQGRVGHDDNGTCVVPDQERVEVCGLCRGDADCTARPGGRCIGVRLEGPRHWGGYPQCVYPDDPGHPSHAPPCPAPGAETPAATQYVSYSWRIECVAPAAGQPCRWGTCTRHENRNLP